MYTENHILPLLLKASPDWDRALTSHPPEILDEKSALFLTIRHLARYIVQACQEERFDEFPKIFATVELILREGSDRAKELIDIALIESLQNLSTQESLDPELLKKWFKEETLRAWKDIDRFWSRGKK